MELKQISIKKVLFGAGVGLALLLVGIAIGFDSRPYRIKTWREVVYVEKEVRVEKVNKNVKTTIVEDKSGNKTTTIEDTSVIDTKTDKVASGASKEKTVTENKKPSLHVGLQIEQNMGDLPVLKPDYGITVDKKFIGPFFLGFYGSTNKSFGIRLGFSF